MQLTKSTYCLLCQCPRLFWRNAHRTEPRKESAAQKARTDEGKEVGAEARKLFGTCMDAYVERENKQPDIPAMLQKTQEFLDQGAEVISEAAFSIDGMYCAVDFLRRENGGFAIYEVKSSKEIKPHYCIDIAYQRYVLERCGLTVTGTYLVYLNPDYVRGEALDVSRYFAIADVAEQVAREMPLIPDRVKLARELENGPAPDIPIGEHCHDPETCEFWADCTAHLGTPNVFDMYRMQEKKKWKLCRSGLATCQDLASLLGTKQLSKIQKLQVRFGLEDPGTEVKQAALKEFLDDLKYPYYFLDFESMAPAIPQYPGDKAFTQIPFQYSLHILRQPGGKLEHTPFLAESGGDPRRALAERLCRDIPVKGSVIVYNKSFETSRLKELEALFPDLAPGLAMIRENIRDLLDPFKDGLYYTRAIGGSLSIKSVLPALFPDNERLNYKKLKKVHNGTEAMTLFPKLGELPEAEQEEMRQHLLDYCELDTLAMVMIWQKLKEAVGEPAAFIE